MDPSCEARSEVSFENITANIKPCNIPEKTAVQATISPTPTSAGPSSTRVSLIPYEELMSFPKAPCRKETNRGRKKRKSEILPEGTGWKALRQEKDKPLRKK